MISLMDKCFTNKVVTRHTDDKPWVTDYFRCLIRKRQRAFMSGDQCEYKALRNETEVRILSKANFSHNGVRLT